MELTGHTDMARFIQSTQKQPNGAPGRGFQLLKRLAKNKFTVKHRGQAPGAGRSTNFNMNVQMS